MIYCFCVFTIVGILKVSPGANLSNAFLAGYFLQLNCILNFTKYFLAAEAYALNH